MELKEYLFFERRGLIVQDEPVDDVVQLPVKDGAQVVKAFAEPVIGDPGLRKIVGPDLLAPLPGPDLRTAVPGDPRLLFVAGDLHEAGAENSERLLFVPVLRLFVLAGDHHPRGAYESRGWRCNCG